MAGEGVIPALTAEERTAVERRLRNGNRVLCSVFVDEAAQITVEVKVPPGITDDGTDVIARAVEKAVGELAPVVGKAAGG